MLSSCHTSSIHPRGDRHEFPDQDAHDQNIGLLAGHPCDALVQQVAPKRSCGCR